MESTCVTTRSAIRAQFAILLQEPLLVSTTIAENIAYAKQDASLEEIMNAARAANVGDHRGTAERLRHRCRRARRALGR